MSGKNKKGGPDGSPRTVGYRCPPPRREGEIRNPWGRNGKPKPRPEFMEGFITLQVNGDPVQVTRDEALDHFLFSRASKDGDPQAIKRLEERWRRRQGANQAPDDATLSEEEQAAFDDYIRRQARKFGGRVA